MAQDGNTEQQYAAENGLTTERKNGYLPIYNSLGMQDFGKVKEKNTIVGETNYHQRV